MADTVKALRCDARAAGTGTRCTLPDGHAAPHCAGLAVWPSESSKALAETEQRLRDAEQKLADVEQELRTMEAQLRDMASELRADATMEGVAHDPSELLRWFEKQFPRAFPQVRQDLDRQARRTAQVTR